MYLKKAAKKKPRRLTKKKLQSLARTARRQKLSDWGREIRERDRGCVVCGTTASLNVHHLLPKEIYPELMFELMCGVTLCVRHHKWGRYAAHKNGLWFAEFFRRARPEQYAWAIQHAGEPQADCTPGIVLPATDAVNNVLALI